MLYFPGLLGMHTLNEHLPRNFTNSSWIVPKGDASYIFLQFSINISVTSRRGANLSCFFRSTLVFISSNRMTERRVKYLSQNIVAEYMGRKMPVSVLHKTWFFPRDFRYHPIKIDNPRKALISTASTSFHVRRVTLVCASFHSLTSPLIRACDNDIDYFIAHE